jgi:hypothetical protein
VLVPCARGLAIIGHYSSRIAPILLPAVARLGLFTHYEPNSRYLEGESMTHHKKFRPDSLLSDWDEVWALILPFVLQLSFALILIGVLAVAGRSAQAGEVMGLDTVRQGSLLFADGRGGYRPAVIQRTEVEIDVSGMIARAKVRQRFTNNSEQWAEGIYVFPLPEAAAVDHLRMQIGERIITGRIQERQAAKHHYEQAKAQGKKAALIEQERPNLFTNSVANIAPHETVVVEIEYQQVLRYDNGEFRLRFPMAVTPRYIPGTASEESLTRFDRRGWAVDTDRVPDASRITPPVWRGEGKINPIALTVHLDAGFPLARVTSPYHAIRRVDEDAARGITTISLADNDTVADRDFELSWAPVPGRAPRAALFSEQVGAERYHLLMVLPPGAAPAPAPRGDLRHRYLGFHVRHLHQTSQTGPDPGVKPPAAGGPLQRHLLQFHHPPAVRRRPSGQPRKPGTGAPLRRRPQR